METATRHGPAGILVRPVRPDDAPAVVAVLNPIIAAGGLTVIDGPLTAGAEGAYIGGFPERGSFLVAEDVESRRVLGFQTLEPFAPYSHAFDHVAVMGTFVDLAYRRRGIGRRLFESTAAAARALGYEKILTYVLAGNLPSLAFHRALGCNVVGTARRQAKLGSRYHDEVIIERFLTDASPEENDP